MMSYKYLACSCADASSSMQEDPEWTAEKELCMRRGIPYVPPKQKENIDDEDYMSAEAGALSVGERCEVDPGGKRGVIRSASIWSCLAHRTHEHARRRCSNIT